MNIGTNWCRGFKQGYVVQPISGTWNISAHPPKHKFKYSCVMTNIVINDIRQRIIKRKRNNLI